MPAGQPHAASSRQESPNLARSHSDTVVCVVSSPGGDDQHDQARGAAAGMQKNARSWCNLAAADDDFQCLPEDLAQARELWASCHPVVADIDPPSHRGHGPAGPRGDTRSGLAGDRVWYSTTSPAAMQDFQFADPVLVTAHLQASARRAASRSAEQRSSGCLQPARCQSEMAVQALQDMKTGDGRGDDPDCDLQAPRMSDMWREREDADSAADSHREKAIGS